MTTFRVRPTLGDSPLRSWSGESENLAFVLRAAGVAAAVDRTTE